MQFRIIGFPKNTSSVSFADTFSSRRRLDRCFKRLAATVARVFSQMKYSGLMLYFAIKKRQRGFFS